MAAPAPLPPPGKKPKPRPTGLPKRALPYPEPVERLIGELARLPGIGPRAAERIALHILRSPRQEAEALASAAVGMRSTIGHCSQCFNLAALGDSSAERPTPAAGSAATAATAAVSASSTPLLCAVCSEPSRDPGLILVVEQPRDILAIEQLKMYNGLYHVLLGRLSPLEGIGAGQLTIAFLLDRIAHCATSGRPIREVILGLSPTLEGDGTMLYLSDKLAGLGIPATRLSRGLPAGQALEYASKTSLAEALEGRRGV